MEAVGEESLIFDSHRDEISQRFQLADIRLIKRLVVRLVQYEYDPIAAFNRFDRMADAAGDIAAASGCDREIIEGNRFLLLKCRFCQFVAT
jgi:hypothetical protein